jgi:hypothetical protein
MNHSGTSLGRFSFIQWRNIMKKFVLLTLLGAMTLTSVAQTATKDETVTISGSKAEMMHATRSMSPSEFGRFTGSYELSNGNSLALFSRGLKKFAALHGEAWHEIVATSDNSFVAKDHQLKLDIYREDDGTVHGDLYLPRDVAQTADNQAGQQLVKVAFH